VGKSGSSLTRMAWENFRGGWGWARGKARGSGKRLTSRQKNHSSGEKQGVFVFTGRGGDKCECGGGVRQVKRIARWGE